MTVDAESGHVLRTLRAVELLAEKPSSEAELAEALEVHTRTVRRLLERLVEAGYAAPVEGHPVRYVATLKIVAIAGAVLARTDLVQLARPFVTALRDESDESAYLTVPTGAGAMHVLHEDSANVIAARPRLSEIVPFHATAVGKVLLAHGAAPEPPEPLEQCSEFTVTERADLRVQLEETRQRGYAVDDREHDRDQRCVAAPVYDHAGAVVAALGICAPAFRLTSARVPAAGELTARVAGELSRANGFSGKEPAAEPAEAVAA
jgi:DNA-binding IclR family transcriptional regulator